MIYKGKRQGTRFALDSKRYLWGTYFEQVFVSDSGANWASDLNEVLVKEHIVQGTLPDNAMGGYLPNLIFTEEWLLVGDPKLKFDNHAVGHLASNSSQARLEIGNRIFRLGAGPATYWQLFRFRDRRTGGVSNPPTYVVDKSAFTIVTDLQLVGNDPHITVTKSGGGLWPFVSGGTVTGTQPGQFEIQ
jgi:hypothetical protein